MPRPALTIPEALAILRATLAIHAPGFVPLRITIKGASGKLSWPFLDAVPAAPAAEDEFLPNEVQAVILQALEGKYMRSDVLASAINTALGIEDGRKRLFKRPGGVQELTEQGLVKNHPRRGYYSLASPPEELEAG